MNILVINSGSSSIKYQLFDGQTMAPLASGLVEKIGEPGSRVKHSALRTRKRPAGTTFELNTIEDVQIANHRQGLALMVDLLLDDEIGVIEALVIELTATTMVWQFDDDAFVTWTRVDNSDAVSVVGIWRTDDPDLIALRVGHAGDCDEHQSDDRRQGGQPERAG